MKVRAVSLALPLVTSLFISGAAVAGTPFSHPAVAPNADVAGVVEQARLANPAIVGHPASPHWAIVHANGEHPAVLQARPHANVLDANTFIVQPPASTTWTRGSAPAAVIAQITR
jgi:hypothetical protein